MAGVPQIVQATTTGTTAGAAVDVTEFNYGIGIVVGFATGTSATYTVECTGDRLDTDDSLKMWVALPLLTSKTTALTSNLAYPVTALRLNVASLSGGPIQLSVITA